MVVNLEETLGTDGLMTVAKKKMATPHVTKAPTVPLLIFKLFRTATKSYPHLLVQESETQHSSQPLDQVNNGTPPDEMVRSFEDYNWELGRMIRYRRNDKGGTDRL